MGVTFFFFLVFTKMMTPSYFLPTWSKTLPTAQVKATMSFLTKPVGNTPSALSTGEKESEVATFLLICRQPFISQVYTAIVCTLLMILPDHRQA